MMDEPAADELTAVVASFLRSTVVPALAGPLAFDARVAANVLDLAVREIRLGPAAASEERARLVGLLGHEGPLDALGRELCTLIREGRQALSHKDLLQHLRATTLAKLAIDQPGYATYREVLALGWDGIVDEPWPDDLPPNELPSGDLPPDSQQDTPARISR